MRSRRAWASCLAGIVAAGIFSRAVHSGITVFDKYAGDALYAAMVYVILRLLWPRAGVAVWAMAIMAALEVFQLTLIPAHMLHSTSLAVRIAARLLGTHFSFFDLFLSAVGIGGIWLVDSRSAE